MRPLSPASEHNARFYLQHHDTKITTDAVNGHRPADLLPYTVNDLKNFQKSDPFLLSQEIAVLQSHRTSVAPAMRGGVDDQIKALHNALYHAAAQQMSRLQSQTGSLANMNGDIRRQMLALKDGVRAVLPQNFLPGPVPPAPQLTSTTATPEPQRTARTDATGGQILPGNSSQKTSLPQAALHNLPNELLLEIAGRTGPTGARGNSLSPRMLSDHAVAALNDKETLGNEQEKRLSGLAKQAIGSGQLQISPNQPANGIARFEKQDNQGVLAIEAKLNESSKYDVLSVGFKRGSEATVSMTLPIPSRTVAHNTPRPSALLGLPPELLLQIADGTGRHGEGVNLSLQRVSKHMKAIADDQMSPNQRFLVQNGQNLHAAGYSRSAMNDLFARPVVERDFVTTHAQQLRANGYNVASQFNNLAARPTAERDFVLSHAQQLHVAGYDNGGDMNTLAARPVTEQQFVLNNAQRLQAVGYKGEKMNELAAMPAAARDFVLTHAQQLRANGYNFAFQFNNLAARPTAERDFVLSHAQQLHVAGYDNGGDMNTLAARPATEQQFVLNNAQRLQAVGYKGVMMNELAAMPAAARDFVLTHAQQLRANGYNFAFQINRLAAQSDQREAFLRQIGHRS